MPTWIIIAALASVGLTLLLTSILRRANVPTQREKRASGGSDTPFFLAGEQGSSRSRHDSDNDGGGDGGVDGNAGDGDGGGGGGGD